MGYTNETTHYGIPLPLGSDLTTPMDYNTAAEAVDAAVFEAVSNSSGAVDTAAEAVQTANTASTTAAGAVTEAQTAHAVADAAATAAGTAQSLANSALAQIDEIKPRTIASVTGDGVKTLAQVYDELCAAIPSGTALDRLKLESVNGNITTVRSVSQVENGVLKFYDMFALEDASRISFDYIFMRTSGSKRISAFITTSGVTIADSSSVVSPAGEITRLVIN